MEGRRPKTRKNVHLRGPEWRFFRYQQGHVKKGLKRGDRLLTPLGDIFILDHDFHQMSSPFCLIRQPYGSEDRYCSEFANDTE